MKKIIYIFILLLLFTTGCKKKNNEDKKPQEESNIMIDLSSVKDAYYVGEVNLKTIYLFTNDEQDYINLNSSMLNVDVNKLEKGTHEIEVSYNDKKTTFRINLVEREYYTPGLLFVLMEDETYMVSSYIGEESNIIIPSIYEFKEVTEIKKNAFNSNTNIKSVKLPSTIKKINDAAFQGCSNLEEVSFNEGLESIGKAAFYMCDNLNHLIIPTTVEQMGERALYSPEFIYTSKESIDSKVLGEDNKYVVHTKLDLNKIEIDENYLYYNDEEITLFEYLRNDKDSVVIEKEYKDKKVAKIGERLFCDHEEITNLVIHAEIKEIPDYCFKGISISNFVMPNSVETIGIYSFAGTLKLENVVFSNNLKEIGRSAFASCEIIKEAILPDGLVKIDSYAFQNCYKLMKVYLPISITSIGEGAFYNIGKGTIYYEGENIPSNWNPNFNPSKRTISYNSNRDML